MKNIAKFFIPFFFTGKSNTHRSQSQLRKTSVLNSTSAFLHLIPTTRGWLEAIFFSLSILFLAWNVFDLFSVWKLKTFQKRKRERWEGRKLRMSSRGKSCYSHHILSDAAWLPLSRFLHIQYWCSYLLLMRIMLWWNFITIISSRGCAYCIWSKKKINSFFLTRKKMKILLSVSSLSKAEVMPDNDCIRW